MNRRSFLTGLISTTSLVAVSRAVPGAPESSFLGNSYVSVQSAWPIIRGDGIHDDSAGIQAFINGLEFVDEVGGLRTEVGADGRVIKHLSNGVFFVPKGVSFPRGSTFRPARLIGMA